MLQLIVPDPEPPKPIVEGEEEEEDEGKEEASISLDDENALNEVAPAPVMYSYSKFLTLRALTKEFSSLRPIFDRLKNENHESKKAQIASGILNGIYTPDDISYGYANYRLDHILSYKNSSIEDNSTKIYENAIPVKRKNIVSNSSSNEEEKKEENKTDDTEGKKSESQEEEVKKEVVPSPEPIGTLNISWTALPPGSNGETEFDPENDLPEITEETPLLGQACTYKLEIIGGKQFSRGVKGAYCQYKFNGATYQTDRIQLTEKEEKNGTNNPMFNFMKIHHVESVDQQFLDSLNSGLEVQIFIVDIDKLPDISAPVITKFVKENWKKIANETKSENEMLSFRQYQILRLDEGVDTEPQEREWLNYIALMDGGYAEWLSTEIYKTVGKKK